MEDNQGTLGELSPQEISQRLNLPFRNYSLLARALTHRSYINEHPEALEDNERLEFLGDAVLDFLVGAWLYNRFPEMGEGFLTRLRASLVGNHQLAEFARQIDLGSVMRLGHGEADGGGRSRGALLGCTFEALIGALYIDQEIAGVNRFVIPLLEKATSDILDENKDQDPKSRLQEWSQGNGLGAPQYRTVGSTGPDHEKLFEIEVVIAGQARGRGSGNSKRVAAKAAAIDALNVLGLD